MLSAIRPRSLVLVLGRAAGEDHRDFGARSRRRTGQDTVRRPVPNGPPVHPQLEHGEQRQTTSATAVRPPTGRQVPPAALVARRVRPFSSGRAGRLRALVLVRATAFTLRVVERTAVGPDLHDDRDDPVCASSARRSICQANGGCCFSTGDRELPPRPRVTRAPGPPPLQDVADVSSNTKPRLTTSGPAAPPEWASTVTTTRTMPSACAGRGPPRRRRRCPGRPPVIRPEPGHHGEALAQHDRVAVLDDQDAVVRNADLAGEPRVVGQVPQLAVRGTSAAARFSISFSSS